MLPGRPWIDVSNLHPWSDIQAVTHKASQDAGNTRRNRKLTMRERPDNRDMLAGLDKVTYLSHPIEFPCSHCPQQPLYGIATDGPGYACIWLSTPMQVNASQVVSPIGLDYCVDIFASLITWTKCDNDRSVFHCYTAIIL